MQLDHLPLHRLMQELIFLAAEKHNDKINLSAVSFPVPPKANTSGKSTVIQTQHGYCITIQYKAVFLNHKQTFLEITKKLETTLRASLALGTRSLQEKMAIIFKTEQFDEIAIHFSEKALPALEFLSRSIQLCALQPIPEQFVAVWSTESTVMRGAKSLLQYCLKEPSCAHPHEIQNIIDNINIEINDLMTLLYKLHTISGQGNKLFACSMQFIAVKACLAHPEKIEEILQLNIRRSHYAISFSVMNSLAECMPNIKKQEEILRKLYPKFITSLEQIKEGQHTRIRLKTFRADAAELKNSVLYQIGIYKNPLVFSQISHVYELEAQEACRLVFLAEAGAVAWLQAVPRNYQKIWDGKDDASTSGRALLLDYTGVYRQQVKMIIKKIDIKMLDNLFSILRELNKINISQVNFKKDSLAQRIQFIALQAYVAAVDDRLLQKQILTLGMRQLLCETIRPEESVRSFKNSMLSWIKQKLVKQPPKVEARKSEEIVYEAKEEMDEVVE